MSSQKKTITASMIALINVAAVCSIKNFPALAEFGVSVILFLILSAIFFFLPVAFVASELASGWPERGIYTWVKEALGPRLGFLAIWLQWIENVIYYPTLLSFIAVTFFYAIDPALATNPLYVVGTVLTVFWAATLVNFLGMRVSGWVSSISALFGTIIPIALIIILGAGWVFGNHPSQLSFSWEALFPDLTSFSQLALLSGVLFGLSGMEMSAVHARDVRDPRRDYPKGILLSAGLILIFSALGALAIAAIVPNQQIALVSGGMEAFRIFFQALNMPWAMPIIAIITAGGALGMLSTWIIGPSRGLYAAAIDGDLPPILQKSNKHGMPVSILIAQAVIASTLSLVFLFMPSVTSSYWILIALASILYQIMYVLMFISSLVLRYKHPHVHRIFKIPFGNVGIWIVSTFGMIGSLFGLGIAFFPPSQFEIGKLPFFEAFLIGGTLLFLIIPLWIYELRKKSWGSDKERV